MTDKALLVRVHNHPCPRSITGEDGPIVGAVREGRIVSDHAGGVDRDIIAEAVEVAARSNRLAPAFFPLEHTLSGADLIGYKSDFATIVDRRKSRQATKALRTVRDIYERAIKSGGLSKRHARTQSEQQRYRYQCRSIQDRLHHSLVLCTHLHPLSLVIDTLGLVLHSLLGGLSPGILAKPRWLVRLRKRSRTSST